MRIDAITIQGANVRHVVRRFGVLEYVDEISDGPVSRIDLHAGVEKDGVAVREGVSGEGGDVAHVIYLIWGGGRFVEEDTTNVDILLRCAGPIGPVLIGGDFGFEDGWVSRRWADPVLIWTTVVPCGGMHVREGTDIGIRVESGERVDVVAVRAGITAGATVDIDDGLEDEGRVGGSGVKKGLPGIIARVDVEREEDETRIDHDGEIS